MHEVAYLLLKKYVLLSVALNFCKKFASHVICSTSIGQLEAIWRPNGPGTDGGGKKLQDTMGKTAAPPFGLVGFPPAIEAPAVKVHAHELLRTPKGENLIKKKLTFNHQSIWRTKLSRNLFWIEQKPWCTREPNAQPCTECAALFDYLLLELCYMLKKRSSSSKMLHGKAGNFHLSNGLES